MILNGSPLFHTPAKRTNTVIETFCFPYLRTKEKLNSLQLKNGNIIQQGGQTRSTFKQVQYSRTWWFFQFKSCSLLRKTWFLIFVQFKQPHQRWRSEER